MKYRKKPVVIEAFQMTRERYTNRREWPEWLILATAKDRSEPGAMWMKNGELLISTLEGNHTVSWDDFIIRGVQFELYPCKPDIFEQTYEPAE